MSSGGTRSKGVDMLRKNYLWYEKYFLYDIKD